MPKCPFCGEPFGRERDRANPVRHEHTGYETYLSMGMDRETARGLAVGGLRRLGYSGPRAKPFRCMDRKAAADKMRQLREMRPLEEKGAGEEGGREEGEEEER